MARDDSVFAPRMRRSAYKSRLNREQSRFRVLFLPALSVIFGSMVTALPFILDHPFMPSFGLLMLLGWRMLRPGIWPLWAGFPLGLVDDLYSGQPLGSAVIAWSLILIVFHILEARMAWRSYWRDWIFAVLAIGFAQFLGLFIVGIMQPRPDALVLVPQILASALIFPLILRLCAMLDRWRLST